MGAVRGDERFLAVLQPRQGAFGVGSLPGGETAFPGSLLMTRELTLTGAFRFDHEFDTAIEWLAGGLYVDPIVTHTYPLEDARAAFDLATDRTVASKVLLDLSGDTQR